jgi:hypothetical protein
MQGLTFYTFHVQTAKVAGMTYTSDNKIALLQTKSVK